jgi:ComF family protein
MAAFDLLIPPVCVGCSQKLDDGKAMLCAKCSAKIKAVSPHGCPKCGSPLEEGHCAACHDFNYDFDLARAVYSYDEPLTSMIHNLKYREHTKSTGFLAKGIAGYISEQPQYQNSDFITAVPLHPVRKRERGYNQSELIARKVSKLTGIKYIEAVKRSRYTASQTMLHKEQRLHNLNGAFRINRKADLRGKSIILLDDVFTTGSTINEISKTLHAAGAAKVLGLTACRA